MTAINEALKGGLQNRNVTTSTIIPRIGEWVVQTAITSVVQRMAIIKFSHGTSKSKPQKKG
ncbi:MAG: hypothetical protein JKX94_05870 [Sneathiella sp.]|nr:hypothetical protein [Sneathiella sp.]